MILAPSKVFGPNICSGIKESDNDSFFKIEAASAGVLVAVASPTRNCEVAQFVRPSESCWLNVIDYNWIGRIGEKNPAVLTSRLCALNGGLPILFPNGHSYANSFTKPYSRAT